MLFALDGNPLGMGIALSSRVFPMIPSPAVGRYLSAEFGLRPPSPRPRPAMCLQSNGMIKHIIKTRPADKPSVASVQEGLMSNLAHLAVFCLSTDIFHCDCKVKLDGMDRNTRARDPSEYDAWQSSPHENDAGMITVPDGGAWFRFECGKTRPGGLHVFQRSPIRYYICMTALPLVSERYPGLRGWAYATWTNYERRQPARHRVTFGGEGETCYEVRGPCR
ncbi:hypothetical protein MBLNU13_g07350t1 [Cladosporium sp. NU13]